MLHYFDFDILIIKKTLLQSLMNLKLILYLMWQFSLANSLNVGDNILGRLGRAVKVGDVALSDTLPLLLHCILLIFLVEVPLEAALARIKSDNKI